MLGARDKHRVQRQKQMKMFLSVVPGSLAAPCSFSGSQQQRQRHGYLQQPGCSVRHNAKNQNLTQKPRSQCHSQRMVNHLVSWLKSKHTSTREKIWTQHWHSSSSEVGPVQSCFASVSITLPLCLLCLLCQHCSLSFAGRVSRVSPLVPSLPGDSYDSHRGGQIFLFWLHSGRRALDP